MLSATAVSKTELGHFYQWGQSQTISLESLLNEKQKQNWNSFIKVVPILDGIFEKLKHFKDTKMFSSSRVLNGPV